MQRRPRMPCAIKKLMVDESAWTFLSQKGPTLPHLVSTWDNQLTKERGVVVVTTDAAVAAGVEVEAEAVTVMMMTEEVQEVTAAVEEAAVMTIEVTAEVEAAVAVETVTGTVAGAAEIAADRLLRTTVLSAVVHVPDPTHPPAVTDRNGKTILKKTSVIYRSLCVSCSFTNNLLF